MKQKLYLLLMLAAPLFVACSSDDDDKEPAKFVFDGDYSSVIDMSYSAMIRQYPNPSMQFSDFYVYENPSEKVEGLTIAVNPDNQKVYLVMEMLKEKAYKEEDLVAYFKGKFKYYGVEKQDAYDDDGNVVGQTNIYSFGNTEKKADATLTVTLTGNESVYYENPKNQPAEPEESALDEMTPVEIVNALMLGDLEEIEEDYPGAFSQMGDMYVCFFEESPYLAGVAFTLDEGLVTTVILLYNEDLTDEDIVAYYTENGYTCTKTGYDEEEEADIYTFTNEYYSISYSAGRGEVTCIE